MISCSTPAGWTGWKEEAFARDGYDPHSRMLIESAMTVQLSFSLPNCRDESCPSLSLDTAARESPGPPDIRAAVRSTARELSDGTVPVSKAGVFDAGHGGRSTIWRFRWDSGEHCFMTVISERDVQAIISLCGRDLNKTRAKLDSLKELARSVRITEGTFASADMIRINVEQPDEGIRQQLLQLTPLGEAKDSVLEFLNRRLVKDAYRAYAGGLHRRGNDLEVDLGHYANGQEITSVKAVWRFARTHKLRAIEVRRVVER